MKKVILATVFMLFGCESAQMQSFNKAMFGDLGNSISYQNNNAINNVQHQDDVDYFYKMVVSNDTIEALTATTTIRGYWLGYISAIVTSANSQTSKKVLEQTTCLLDLNAGIIKDRFEILYQRNTFDVGEYTVKALEKTLLNLCSK